MKKNYIFIIILFISLFTLKVMADDYDEIKKLYEPKGYTVTKCNIAKNWAVIDWKYKRECEGMALLKYTDGKWTTVCCAGGAFDYDFLSQKDVPLELWQKLIPTDIPRWTYLTSKERLTYDRLENDRYTPLILTLMRNEIFAKYGRKFNDPLLRSYFETCPWYKINPYYNDNMLTKIERYNAQLILDYQKYNNLLY